MGAQEPGRVRSCRECRAFIDTRCPKCGCCNHTWDEDNCPCMGDDCGCRENREPEMYSLAWDRGDQ